MNLFLKLMMFMRFGLVLVSTEAPVYLSSQSYMADSSLSEEMSQFDFSTGVQSFSVSSQNPEGRRRTVVKRVSHVLFCFDSIVKSKQFLEACPPCHEDD